MVTFSLCMIVKDEEAVLSRCLDSLCDVMDEIIIVDTGSTDKTKEIAKRYTDKIFDYKWCDDFADARNFASSKAVGDYIYTADADEYLDDENKQKLRQLKKIMLPEIEIVQMIYHTPAELSTVYNFEEEYRPKLYKRFRNFTWIDQIHETLRIDPIVYDSDIVVEHRPLTNHASRDFASFERMAEDIVAGKKRLSKKLHHMYAMELFRSGDDKAFLKAEPVFKKTLEEDGRSMDEVKEAFCVLARCYRLKGDIVSFMECALKDAATVSCAEICCELGAYYESARNTSEAVMWYQNALTETESILDIRSSKEIPQGALRRLTEWK